MCEKQETHMTDKVTDLKSYKFTKAADTFIGAIGDIYRSERAFFETGKFLPYADSYIASGFDEEYRPTFHVLIDFRDYKPTEEAQALLKRLKSDRFELRKTKYGREYLAEIKKKGTDHNDSFGPVATAELRFDEVQGIFAGRESGKFGAYQPSASGFRTVCRKNWDHRGIGFNIVVCGNDHRRNKFEEHIIDDQSDMDEVAAMMARIRVAQMAPDTDEVVPFRR
jgi:hypothetical protein